MMTCTVHQLFHIAKFVERFGPLWTTWMFMFESWNGFVKSFIHSKQNIEVQLLDAFKLHQSILVIEDNLPCECMYFVCEFALCVDFFLLLVSFDFGWFFNDFLWFIYSLYSAFVSVGFCWFSLVSVFDFHWFLLDSVGFH